MRIVKKNSFMLTALMKLEVASTGVKMMTQTTGGWLVSDSLSAEI